MDNHTLPALSGDYSDPSRMLFDPVSFEQAQRVAKLFAASSLVPAHIRNVSDCLIALHMAMRLREDPLSVLQNIYVVSGRPGWSASYMIARANRSGIFRGPIRWRSEGSDKTLKVTAVARLAEVDEDVEVTVSMEMAEAEGWTKNAKYKSMPEHMLRWRSATMLIRLYAPDVMLGMETADEIEDHRAAGQLIDVTPERPRRSTQRFKDAGEPAGSEGIIDTDGEPATYDLIDEVGDVYVSPYPPDQWWQEFYDHFSALHQPADRLQLLENNEETLAELDHGQWAGEEAAALRKQIADAAQEREGASPAAEELGLGQDGPKAGAPADDGRPAPSEAPWPLVVIDGSSIDVATAAQWVAAVEGMVDAALASGASPRATKQAWRANSATMAEIAADDTALGDRLRAAGKRLGV